MNIQKPEVREFCCEIFGEEVRGTVTQYLAGVYSPDSLTFQGVRYTVKATLHDTKYKFTMFFEKGEWHTRLLSVFDEDRVRLASLEIFIHKESSPERLFETALEALRQHVPGGSDVVL
jgi:hypothetical protein